MLTVRKRRVPLAIGAFIGAVLATGLVPAAATASVRTADQATAAASPESVTSTVRNADGTVTQTVYTPAPGVTATQLSQRLRAAGVASATVTSAPAGPAGGLQPLAVVCQQGTARTWPTDATCFVRWSYNGAVRPIIDFVDHSGASWPVGRAVTEWNKTSGIDSIYRTAASGCDGGAAHCVSVYSGNYGNQGWVGQTSRTFNTANTYYASAKVELNDYYGGTETEKWASACHELGHVLGLDHNVSTSSCLYYARVAGGSKYPNADDYALLERYY